MPDSLESKALFICEQVLEQSPADREHWINAACGEDETLLQRVNALLARIEPTEVGLADDNALLNFRSYAAPDDTEEPPESLGAYRLLELIGEGGMGSVYKAERSDGAFDRTVAIKLVGAVRSRSDAEVRFTTERQILARMQHPNIAQLLDGGTEEDRGYLVMEFVNGKPFDYDASRDEATTLTIFRKVCAAVQYAHNNLVLHRDIKPDNVLLDENDEPKLLDFGIAKLNQEFSDAGSADVTGTNAIPLTLNYSAPERLLGEPATVSSDVYSLGVYLFVLLKGIRPYDLTGKTLPEAWKLLKERTLEDSSGTRSDLDMIAIKAMNGDADLRYASAAELAADVARYQAGHTITARASDWRYSAKKFVARNKLAVAASTGGLVALLSAFAMTGVAYLESERQKQIASEEAITANQTVNFLTSILGSANPWLTDQKNTTVEDVLIQAKSNLEAGAIDNPAARSFIETSLAMAHDGRGDYAEALAYAKSAADRLTPLNRTGTQKAQALYVLGLVQSHVDDNETSIATLKLAMETNPLQTSDDQWLQVEIETALGASHEAIALEEIALANYARALKRTTELPDTRTDPLIVLENNLGRLLHKLGRFDEAIGHYSQSIKISSATGNELRRAITYSNIAGVHGDKKEWPQAIELMEKSLAIHAQANTLTTPDAIITRTSLANIQRRVGNLDAASATIGEALGVAEETLGDEHFITAYVQNVAAIVYCDTGNWQEGLDFAKRSLATREKILPPTHWTLHSSRSVLGACETSAGNFDVADVLLNDAYQKLEELRGAEGTQTMITKERLDALTLARASHKQKTQSDEAQYSN